MKYNLSNNIDKQRFKARCNDLFKEGCVVDLTKVAKKRSYKQNRYLHIILSWFAVEYGEQVDYVKQHFFKKICNPLIFRTEYVNKKTGEVRKDWRSTASIDSAEMTIAIDRFRDFSSKEAGIYLPDPTDLAYLQEIEIETDKQKQYL